MPGTAPRGFPYPLPTEPVTEGAQAIRNLAEYADARVPQLVETKVLSAAGPFAFTGIPQTFENLMLRLYVRSNGNGAPSAIGLRMNGDVGPNYHYQRLYGLAAAAGGSEGVNTSEIQIGYCPGTPAVAGMMGAVIVDILGYRRAFFKPCTAAGSGAFGAGASGVFSSLFAGAWRNFGAITRLDLLPLDASPFQFAAGSVASLYGL